MPKKLTPRGQAAAPPPVEEPTPAKKPTAKKKPARKATKKRNDWIRNVRYTTVRATLSDTRFELKPRGERGDMAQVSDEHKDDPYFEDNIGMLYEVIEDDLAREIIQKQSTNQQVHTPLDFLLNERGERYQQAPVTAPSYEQQGEVVASIEQTGQGRYTQDNTEVRRNAGPPQIANVPGSVGNPVPEVPSHIPAEQVADWVARNYGDAAGEALRASLNVSVAPTQREITPGQ